MTDVFISHARSTIALTHRIAGALRALGYSVWWDDELPVHRPFSPLIREHLQAAKAILVIWSTDAIDADWVNGEAEVGRVARKLVQVSADGAVPPLPFNQTQYADLIGWHGEVDASAWRKVVASIAELVSGTTMPRAAPKPPIPSHTPAALGLATLRRRWALVVAATGLFAIIAGAFGWFAAREREAVTTADATNRSQHDTADAVAFADRPAIAVLPFDNRSEDPQYAIFADGLAEDLIGRLAAWRAFPVIGRLSSFRYRGDVDVGRVAADLGVRYVVQGSVRRTANRIRVSAQLVDVSSKETIWSNRYDRTIADFFELQDEISSAIVAPLVGDLTRAEGRRAQRRGTRDLEAWSQYQLGETHFVRFTTDEVAEARRHFERAVALEPQFASAHAELANSYTWQVALGAPREPNLSVALQSARRAVQLDPHDAQAHGALGYALLMSNDTASGLASAERAVELNPSSPYSLSTLAYARLMAGDAQGCIAVVEQWLRLDPQLLPQAAHENLSEAYFELGRFDRGLEHARKALAAQPDFLWGHLDAAMNAARLGRLDEARAAIAEARRIQPNLSLEWVRQTSGVTRPEMRVRWNAALQDAGLD